MSKPNNLISSYFNNQINKQEPAKANLLTANTSAAIVNPIPISVFDGTSTAVTSAQVGQIIKPQQQPITLIPIGKLSDKLNGFTPENLNFLQQINLGHHAATTPALSSTGFTTTTSGSLQQHDMSLEPCIETVEISTATVEIEIDSNNNADSTSVGDNQSKSSIHKANKTKLEKNDGEKKKEKKAAKKEKLNKLISNLNNDNNQNERSVLITSSVVEATAISADNITKQTDSDANMTDTALNNDNSSVSKRNKTSKSKTATKDKNKEIIKCICKMDHDDGYMICCDNCQ